MNYRKALFIKSAAKLSDCPPDEGIEIAFAGRSNAGKSSALNAITQNGKLSRVSKTPGRTQLINFFQLDEQRRLVDLPGYGYAKVAKNTKRNWEINMNAYLLKRRSLQGLVLVMDCRHPSKAMDEMFLQWAISVELPVLILLTKADKVSKSVINKTLQQVKTAYQSYSFITIQSFSAVKMLGVESARSHLDDWFHS